MVPAVKPVSLYVSVVDGREATLAPSRSTSYFTTPTVSVLAVHLMDMAVSVAFVFCRLVGLVGAMMSFADDELEETLTALLELRLLADELDFEELIKLDELLAREVDLELLESDRLLEDRDDVVAALEDDLRLLDAEDGTDDDLLLLLLAGSLGVVKVFGSPWSENVLLASMAMM